MVRHTFKVENHWLIKRTGARRPCSQHWTVERLIWCLMTWWWKQLTDPKTNGTCLINFSSSSELQHPSVNLTNVLRAAFTYVSCACSFLCLHFGFVLYWRKPTSAEAAHRTLMKLTPRDRERAPKKSLFTDRFVVTFLERQGIRAYCYRKLVETFHNVSECKTGLYFC
jgi:hypothetical protein